MDEWEKIDSIIAEYTIIALSYQNRPVERAIRTIENSIRIMIEFAKLPAEFWYFAVETDAHTRNLLPRGPYVNREITSP